MSQKGFTLPEVLMAVMVASLVVGGLSGIAAMAARTQAREYRHGTVSSNMTQALTYLTRDLEKAERIYSPANATVLGSTTSISSLTTSQLCMSWCDPLLNSSDGPACLQGANALVNGTPQTHTFAAYCYKQDIEPDGRKIGKLYRHTWNAVPSTAVNPSCTPVTCGTGGTSPELVAVYFDTMTVLRPPSGKEFSRGVVDIEVAGSWWSEASKTSEVVKLRTSFMIASPYIGGPPDTAAP